MPLRYSYPSQDRWPDLSHSGYSSLTLHCHFAQFLAALISYYGDLCGLQDPSFFPTMSSTLPRRICVLILSLLIALDLVSALSAPPRPLRRISFPDIRSLEILPRRPTSGNNLGRRSPASDAPVLLHTDSLRLKLSAYDDTFYLHLRPNDELVHPAARINYYSTDANGQSVLSHTRPLVPESTKAYWGEVIPGHLSTDRLREDAAGVRPRPSGKSELGWARITIHHQGDVSTGLPPLFEGAFSVNGNVHHVMTKENYLRHKDQLDPHIHEDDINSSLVIFRDSDFMSPQEHHVAKGGSPHTFVTSRPSKGCAHDSLTYNTDPYENQALRKPAISPWYDPLGLFESTPQNVSLARRSDISGNTMGTNFADSIGSSNGCPSTQKLVFLGVAADCEYVKQYGSAAAASQQIINNMNMVSALYKSTFNISLGIVEMQVHDGACPATADPATPWNIGCSDSLTLNDRLSLFSDWRGKKGDDGAGLWHLMSGCPTGTEVGIAWLATVCQITATGDAPNVVSGAAVSTGGKVEWQVMAHEMGHNFGAIHDCADGCTQGENDCCPMTTSSCDSNSQFIMSPVAEPSEMKFSPCSLGNICSLMLGNKGGHTNTSCFADPGSSRQTISLKMCGNGIVEDGEDCDPGLGATSSCCDPSTCKFRNNAVCDPASSPCCSDQCSFAPSTQVCRPSKDSSCDTAEMCTGNSSSCPTDVFSSNGKSCGSNGLACANGVCTSLDKQCQSVGASMNLQKACPSVNDQSCQVSCEDPSNFNQCVILQSNLIDGSPCGYGGTCTNGNCQAGSFLDTAKSWYTHNLQISIPVTIVAGIVLILIIWGIISGIKECCNRSSRKKRRRHDMRRLGSWPDGPPAGAPPAVVVNSVGGMGQVPPPRGVPPPSMRYGYGYGPNVPAPPPPPSSTRPHYQGHARNYSRDAWEANEHEPLTSPLPPPSSLQAPRSRRL